MLALESMEVANPAEQTTKTTHEPERSNTVHDNGTNKLDIDNIKDDTAASEKYVKQNSEIPVNDIGTNDSKEPSVSPEEIYPPRETVNHAMSTDELDNEEEQTKKTTESIDTSQTTELTKFFYDWSTTPKLLCSATEEYAPTECNENFTKGCQWSPDGTCLLVPAEDFRIRIYELPRELYSGKVPSELPITSFKAALSVREGGLVYDSCWYPLMNSWDPATCCFLSTSRESPLHLWDAFTGELRATYRPYNQLVFCICSKFIFQ